MAQAAQQKMIKTLKDAGLGVKDIAIAIGGGFCLLVCILILQVLASQVLVPDGGGLSQVVSGLVVPIVSAAKAKLIVSDAEKTSSSTLKRTQDDVEDVAAFA